ncbi:hypothetical protein I553_10750 [Mycobacterium xenopi 4042]|uniref:Uncharacterized protein n=1 Tax=Mycobacterium xenopi 4042 TaxID=1299334 RepID=X8DCI6_MYCXE|nr:hypothetical protein I553_10750 [Mycobacterium xenopi 4042]
MGQDRAEEAGYELAAPCKAAAGTPSAVASRGRLVGAQGGQA